MCMFHSPLHRSYLNSLTTFDTLSWLGGAVVTHPLWVWEVPCSILFCKGVYVWYFVLFCCDFFFQTTHYLSQNFAILIYLVYLTHCKICDRLKEYKGTYIPSLRNNGCFQTTPRLINTTGTLVYPKQWANGLCCIMLIHFYEFEMPE